MLGKPAGSAEMVGAVPTAMARDVVAVSSVERGRGPRPGVYSAPFFWNNLVDGPPPRRTAKGEGAYVVHLALELDVHTRLSYSTVVSVDPGEDAESALDDIIHVDSRLAVQRRFFLEMMYREQAFMDRFTSAWREHMVRSLVKQRVLVSRLPWGWAQKAGNAVVHAQGTFGHAAIRGVRRVSRAAVHWPEEVLTSTIRAYTHLGGRLGRRGIWRGFKDPHTLTTEQKSVVLFLSASAIVATIFVVNNLITLFSPSLAPIYSAMLKTFIWGFLTAIALPFPPSELLVVAPFLVAGPVLAFLTIFTAKIAGAWIVYFIGDALHDLIEKATDGKPRLAKIVAWMNRNSTKYGFWILALFMAAPFLPDTLALYVFAVSGMSFRGYLGGAALGTAVRYAAVVGILVVSGPERVHELFG